MLTSPNLSLEQTMKSLVILVLALLPIACTAKEPAATASNSSEQAPLASAVEPAVHDVICGHKIESVGACGNYVDVDGKWLEIENGAAYGLGAMGWCSSEDSKVEIAGEVKEDKFFATYLKVIG